MRRGLATALLGLLILLGAGGPAAHAMLHSLPGYAPVVDERRGSMPDGEPTQGEDRLSPVCPLSYLPGMRPLPALLLAGPSEVPVSELSPHYDSGDAVSVVLAVAYHARAPPVQG